MYTTMAFIALTMGNVGTTPAWMNDYAAAQKAVAQTGKPMAVFVGNGTEGYSKVVREGAFTSDVNKILAQKFVCVYVDTSKPEGVQLATAFQLNKGMVISDKAGTSQAYSLAGDVAAAELATTLTAYADPKDVKKTETVVKDPKVVVRAEVHVVQGGDCGQPTGCNQGYNAGCCGKSWGFCGKGRTSGCNTGYTGGCGKSWGGWGGGCGKSWGGNWGGSSCGTSYGSGCSTGYATTGGCSTGHCGGYTTGYGSSCSGGKCK